MTLVVKIEKEDVFNKKEINNLFKNIYIPLQVCIDRISEDSADVVEFNPAFEKVVSFIRTKMPKYHQLFLDNQELFDNNEFYNILLEDLSTLSRSVESINLLTANIDEISSLSNPINNFTESFRGIEVAIIALKNTNLILQNELRPKIEEVQRQVEDIERAKLALQNDRIYSVFEAYEKKLKNEADKWESRFFWTIGIGASTAGLLAFCPDLKVGFWNYIFLKVLIISIVLTLSTYFLRRSIHLRKQSDEMGRAAFEMDALPSFMSGLDNDASTNVIYEMIPKYFGRSIDQTQNDKIGDLMQDQLSAGTELIRASAELVKAKGSSTTPP